MQYEMFKIPIIGEINSRIQYTGIYKQIQNSSSDYEDSYASFASFAFFSFQTLSIICDFFIR